MEDLAIRRRRRLRHHYTMTSNVLLFGYKKLSDGAKLTYQVIDSFDWSDSAGLRKGYAFPSVATIAKGRGVSERTIQRHFGELVRAGLLTREERPGQSNVLFIEEVGEREKTVYTQQYAGDDRNDTPPMTKSSPEEREREERQTLVNEDLSLSVGSRGEEKPPQHISRALQEVRRRARRRVPPDKAKRDYLAHEMLRVLKDDHSLGYYRKIAEELEPAEIFEVLSRVKQMSRNGEIQQSRGAAFVALIQRAGGRSL